MKKVWNVFNSLWKRSFPKKILPVFLPVPKSFKISEEKCSGIKPQVTSHKPVSWTSPPFVILNLIQDLSEAQTLFNDSTECLSLDILVFAIKTLFHNFSLFIPLKCEENIFFLDLTISWIYINFPFPIFLWI